MSDRSIHTEGGVVVEGGVRTGGGDFVGRDKITVNITWPAAPFDLTGEPDLEQLRADYLAYLREAHQYLDFKGLPQMERIAQQLPLDAVYVPLQAGDFEDFLTFADRMGLRGASVTIPFKGDALRAASSVDPLARAVGAVNKALPERRFLMMGPGRWGSRGSPPRRRRPCRTSP